MPFLASLAVRFVYILMPNKTLGPLAHLLLLSYFTNMASQLSRHGNALLSPHHTTKHPCCFYK